MDLSFIVPIYNTPLKRLEKCLDSILRIKGLSYEVIMIDDGSESHIGEFCKEYSKVYRQIKYVYKENGGVSSARNKGIEYAYGNYIAFVDSDDTIVSTIFSTDLVDNNADLIIFDMAFHYNCGDTIWEAFCDFESGNVDFASIIKVICSSDRLNSPCAKLFKRDTIVQANIQFNTTMKFAEDEDFVLNFLKLRPSVYYSKEVAYLYWRTEETGKKRLKLYSNTIVENCIAIHIKEQSMLSLMQVTNSEKEQYMSMIDQKKVKAIFNIITDLMLLDEISDEIKEKAFCLIDDISANSISEFSKKLKIEYFLLKGKRWRMISFMSKLREVYLKKRGL